MKNWPGMNTSETPLQEFYLQSKDEVPNKKAIELWKETLPLEQSIARQMWKLRDGTSAEIVSGDFSYDVIWILLVLARKAVAEKREISLSAIMKDGEAVGLVLFTEVTDTYIQKTLNKPRFSSDMIEKSMKKLPLIMMDIKNRLEIKEGDKDGITEHELTLERIRPMVLLDVLTHKKIKRGKGAKTNTERIYRIYFTSIFGMKFIENLWDDKFSFLPVSVLSRPILEQRIMFATCQFSKEAIVSEKQMLRICHKKESKRRDSVYKQRKSIGQALDNLKKDGLKGPWRWDKKKTVYHIFGPKSLQPINTELGIH